MTRERWTQLNEVFAEALEAPGPERAAHIARACGDDDALRAEALVMLATSERTGDFMETSALDTLARDVASKGWSLRPGERVGAYRVEWLLGSGGSGEVWRAHDERLGRDVAIKVLLPHFATDADRLRRFQQEARAAGALNHANVLAVYDVGEHRGAPFLVSECLEGESLRKRLERGPLPLDETLTIALQVARGLSAAHARGIIHRDLKPDNVFLRSDGGVKILDFGLAKLHLTGPSSLNEPLHTVTGIIAGTPSYMAPEQVRGEEVNGRADLFALGAMLYEMLSGQRPFVGHSTIETLHAILTVTPLTLSSVRHEVPPTVSHIVDRCLEKATENRFATADQLVSALEAVIATRRTLATGESLSILGESAIGTRLGVYLMVAYLGSGSVGHVYRARDTRLHRDVLVEIVPKTDAANSIDLTSLQRDVKALAGLSHPNVAATYGVEDIDGFHVLVTEFVEGSSLGERIVKSALALNEALEVAKQIVRALEAIHERGVLVSDLSPSRIIAQPDGSVKVLKFGFAAKGGGSTGSGAYMSPEQARGEPIDRRADLWAFGCVLFEMLTGRAAYPIDSSIDADASVTSHEPDWGTLPAATPRHVRALLYRCLQSEPARRLRDAGDARLELEQPTDSEFAGNKNGPVPATRSLKLAWAVAGIALLAAGGVTTAFIASSRRTPGSGNPMRFIEVTNFAGVEAQPTLSPDGRSVAFVSNRNGQWDVYVALVSGGNLVRITNEPNLELWPRWSPDGTRLLFARLNEAGLTDIWVVPAFGGTARRVVTNATTPAWSHDGRLIAYRSNDTIWVSDADGGNPHAITQPELNRHSEPSFSHDGHFLAFVRWIAGQRSELAFADLTTGKIRNLTSDAELALSPVWSPDDQFVYFTSGRGGTLSAWKIGIGSGELNPITAGQDENEGIDLSADGRRLAFSSSRGNIGLAEMSLDPASRGHLRWLTTDSARGESSPRYSQDGARIAYHTNRNGLELETVWVMDADGENASRVVDDGRSNGFPHWIRDGQAIIFGSRAIDRSTGPGPRECRRVSLSGGAPEVLPIKPFSAWIDVSSDERLIYRASSRAVEIYDLRTNERQEVPNLVAEPSWSPDGRSFAFIVPPSAQAPSDVGLWIATADGNRRQLFRGWVVWFAFDRAGAILMAEGKPDLNGQLLRIDLTTGQRTAVGQVPLLLRHNEVTAARFDVHPDGRRIVLEARPVFESDIGVIDNVR